MRVIQEVRDSLKALSNDEIKKKTKRFFKEQIETYGVKAAEVHMISKERLPRTALRYAIEKMPQDLKKEAMKK